jgi:hypothetical protein
MKNIKYFFWLCSGADKILLEKCRTEGSKYAGIGAAIFFTGLFAAFAGAYALYTVFENYYAAVFFGLVWGLMIFNLDRYIVSSMRKKGKIKKEFYTAVPRIILAILISVVTAKPLEMKIFEKEINAELELMNQQAFIQKTEVIQAGYADEKAELNAQIQMLQSEIDQKAKIRDELSSIAQREADGTGGSMLRNAGPIYKIKKADADRADRELAELSDINGKLIADAYTKLNTVDSAITAEIQTLNRGTMAGPAARMDALSHLTSKSNAVWLANWFIIFLFVAVESAPVFVKLISPRGPYDHLLLTEERIIETGMYESVATQNKDLKKRTVRYPDRERQFLNEKLDADLL